MKKQSLWKLLSGALLFVVMFFAASCVDDNDDNGMPYLEVNPDTLVFNDDGTPAGAADFAVKSNRRWYIEVTDGADWITPSVTEGSGNGIVEFSIPASTVGRVGTVVFSLKNVYGTYFTKEVTIEQGEAPKPGDISELVAFIKNKWPAMESGTETLGYDKTTIEGVILANNEGGNTFGKLYVGDNITLPNSAVILYDTSMFTKDNSNNYPVGKKVTLTLTGAQYAPYGNLRELKGVTVAVSADPVVEVAVPSLSAATFNSGNYQGQYVRVNDITPQSSIVGEFWATSAKRPLIFDAADGNTVQMYMNTATEATGFATIQIANQTGAVYGVGEQNFKKIQVIPTKASDVDAFVASGPKLTVTPADNLTVAGVANSTATLTVTSDIAWTATASTGTGFTFTPASGTGNGTVTVTATADNAEAAAKTLGTLTFAGEGATSVVIDVKQAVKPSAQPKTIAEFAAFVKGMNPTANDETPLSEWVGQTVEGYIAANNSDANLYMMISVVDNTGAVNTGILLSDAAYNTVADYPVGAKITFTIDGTSTVYNSYGVFKINHVTSTVDSSSLATMVVPAITVSEFNTGNYLGMNVKVTGLTYKGTPGDAWYSGSSNYMNRTFNGGADNDLTVRVYKDVTWKNELISTTVTNGTITGVAQTYNGAAQIFPQTLADIADFQVSGPVITGFNPQSLSWLATETDTRDITVLGSNLSGASLTVNSSEIAPFSATVSGTTITVTPPPANTTSNDKVVTLKVSVAGGNSMDLTLTQYAQGSSGSTKGTYTSMSQFIPSADSKDDAYYVSNPTVNGAAASGVKLGTGSLTGFFTSTSALEVTGDYKLSFYALAWKAKTGTIYVRVNGGGSVNGSNSAVLRASDQVSGASNNFPLTDVGDADYFTFNLTGLTAASTITISTSPNFAKDDNTTSGRAVAFGIQVYK